MPELWQDSGTLKIAWGLLLPRSYLSTLLLTSAFSVRRPLAYFHIFGGRSDSSDMKAWTYNTQYLIANWPLS
jgi:hypothetical protein